MSYESWRISFQSSEQAARAAYAEAEALRAEVAELRAARIAYASEFPETKDGGPDTDNIHANIRALKARAERLAEALAGLITWFPSADTYRRLGFDPATPMQVLKEARVALHYECVHKALESYTSMSKRTEQENKA